MTRKRWVNATEEEKEDIIFDPRWEAWPSKLYCFPGKLEEYVDLIRFMIEQDNINYRRVCHHCLSLLTRSLGNAIHWPLQGGSKDLPATLCWAWYWGKYFARGKVEVRLPIWPYWSIHKIFTFYVRDRQSKRTEGTAWETSVPSCKLRKSLG